MKELHYPTNPSSFLGSGKNKSAAFQACHLCESSSICVMSLHFLHTHKLYIFNLNEGELLSQKLNISSMGPRKTKLLTFLKKRHKIKTKTHLSFLPSLSVVKSTAEGGVYVNMIVLPESLLYFSLVLCY